MELWVRLGRFPELGVFALLVWEACPLRCRAKGLSPFFYPCPWFLWLEIFFDKLGKGLDVKSASFGG